MEETSQRGYTGLATGGTKFESGIRFLLWYQKVLWVTFIKAKIKLADFEKHLDLIGISLDDDFPMSSTLANSTVQESEISSGTKKSPSLASCSTLLQVNDDCLMPTYESKAVIQKTPKKILQGKYNIIFYNFT